MKNSILMLAMFMVSGLHICAQTWQWVREENAGPEAYGVACDNAGNVYLSGTASGSASVGTFSNSATTNKGVIAKYDANGNLLWVDFLTGCVGYNVACDATGNAFLCGSFSSSLVIGSQTLVSAGGADIFVAKYSPSGNVLWAASTGGGGNDYSYCVNVDTQGNVIVSGNVGVGNFTFATSPISNTTSTKYFVAKYTNSGTPLWAICGSTGTSSSTYVSSDANNDIYLTGYFSSTTSIGSGTYVAQGADFYLAKFNSAGQPVWTVVGGGSASDFAYCVRVHPSGDVFVIGGYASSPFAISTTTFNSSGNYDVFLARFSNAGNLLWAIKGGGTGMEMGYSMATHTGGVYIAGGLGIVPFTIGTATLTPPTSSSSDNMFLCGIDNSGNVAYSQFINGGGDDAMALDMYNGCSLYLGGDVLTPTLTLGAFTLTHTTSEVFFIAKFNTGINSPTLNLSPSYTLCQGSTITLTASGASTYTWDNGPNTGSFAVSPASTTSYVVAGTSAAGCSTKSVVTVVVAPGAVTLSAVSGTPFCNSNTATLSVTGANTSTWNVGPTTPSISVSPSVTSVYSVTGTSTTGCLYSSSYTINVLPTTPVTVVASPTIICKGYSVILTAGGANTYSWNTGTQQFSVSVSPSITTTYSVTGTNTANGCVTKASIQIQVKNCAGIEENTENSFFNIYPNPNKSVFTLETKKELSLNIFDQFGKLVFEGSYPVGTSSIDISKLANGIYFIKINDAGNVFSYKIVKMD